MTFNVIVRDSLGVFTKRGYKTMREAEDACRFYGNNAADIYDPKFIYARIVDSNGRVRYDLGTDTYDWENPGLNEEGAA